jgi:hypothetical protein
MESAIKVTDFLTLADRAGSPGKYQFFQSQWINRTS